MGDWEPDQTVELAAIRIQPPICGSCPPASRDAGKRRQGDLALKQEYQKVSGTLKSGNVSAPDFQGSCAAIRSVSWLRAPNIAAA